MRALDSGKNRCACIAAGAWFFMLLVAGDANAQVVIPGHPGLHRLPACERAGVEQPCHVTVPNGRFDGPPDDYRYSHGYQPYLFWQWPHSVADHIAPWTYIDYAGTGYPQQDAEDAFHLKSAGDVVIQTVSLPVQGRGGAAGYTVHAHVGSWSGHVDVRMELTLLEGDKVIATANRTLQMRTPSYSASRELTAWIGSPGTNHPTALRVSIATQSGWGATTIDDVFILRAPPDTFVPELQFRPGDARHPWDR